MKKQALARKWCVRLLLPGKGYTACLFTFNRPVSKADVRINVSDWIAGRIVDEIHRWHEQPDDFGG